MRFDRGGVSEHRARLLSRWLIPLLALTLLAGCVSAQHKQTAFVVRTTGTVPTLDRALLVAYGTLLVDLKHQRAGASCGDFTPRLASKLAAGMATSFGLTRGASCQTGFERLFSLSGRSGRSGNYTLDQLLRHIAIGQVEQHGDRATADVTDFFAQSDGPRVRFQRVSGRWRVAQAHLTGAYFCRSQSGVACAGSGVFSLSY